MDNNISETLLLRKEQIPDDIAEYFEPAECGRCYICHMVAVFREVWRVLRSDGTCWVNMGDSYATGTNADRMATTIDGDYVPASWSGRCQSTRRHAAGLKPKDLVGQPWRLAFALQADGWWLRSDIIWHKKNPMPESVHGSHFARHQVTIEDYERLSGLRYCGERGNEDGASNLPVMPPLEILNRQASVSAERQGKSNGQGAGGTPGRERKTPSCGDLVSGKTKQEEIRSHPEGQRDKKASIGEVPQQRAWQAQGCDPPLADEGRPASGCAEASRKHEVRSFGKMYREEETRVCTSQGSTSPGSAGDSRRLVRDRGAPQTSLPLLQPPPSPDDRSRNSAEQGRTSCGGEHRPSVQELQLDEERQTDPSLLVDCPGCHECLPHGGFILRMNAGRPTKSHEYIFLLTKSARYFYDSEAVREPHQDQAPFSRFGNTGANGGYKRSESPDGLARGDIGKAPGGRVYHPAGRNLHSVWTIATEPCSLAHFATFPTKLAETCIKAGTSEKGCCPTCGAPWVRVVERTFHRQPDVSAEKGIKGAGKQKPLNETNGWQGFPRGSNECTTTGWAPSCACPEHMPVPCTVLDCFAGAGTTGLVADRLQRNAILIELSAEYASMARRRIDGDRGPLLCAMEDMATNV